MALYYNVMIKAIPEEEQNEEQDENAIKRVNQDLKEASFITVIYND